MNKTIFAVVGLIAIMSLVIFSSIYYMQTKEKEFYKEYEQLDALSESILKNNNLKQLKQQVDDLKTNWNIFVSTYGSRAVAPYNKDESWPYDVTQMTSQVRDASNFIEQGNIEKAKEAIKAYQTIWQEVFKRNSITFKTE